MSSALNYEILEKIVLKNLDISDNRIKKELRILKEAPDSISKAFVAAYQYCILERNKPTKINDCNSFIAYQLGLTKTAPTKDFNFLVKPVDYPDIDLDFAYPDIVKDYLRQKYDEDKVVAIGTVYKYKFKALVEELCRFIVDDAGHRIVPLEEVTVLNKKLNKIDSQIKTEDESEGDEDLFDNPDVISFQKKYPDVFKHFKSLYALPRHRGQHAAGTVILNEKVRDILPLCVSAGHVTTEFQEGQGVNELSSVGAIKIDILGLKTLKILDTCNKIIIDKYDINDRTPSPCACKKQNIDCPTNHFLPLAIRKSTGERIIDLNKLCLNIPKIYKEIGDLETHGVFQFEPEGISAFTQRYGPKKFEDLAIISALYRPGPLDLKLDELGMTIDEKDPRYDSALSAAEIFIERYNGKLPVVYPAPRLESVLNTTYGITCYQEQLCQVIQAATGESFVEAYKLCKYFSKAKPKYYSEDPVKQAELKRYEDEFKQKAFKNGCSQEEADNIWRVILPFGAYSFNKSHATAYALLTYQTAFFLTHFPLEWFTSLLIHNTDNTNKEKLMEYFYSAQNFGIKVLPPDINKSEMDFTIDNDDNIVAGLSLVKGLGIKAAKVIVENRNCAGPFTSLEDFLSRNISWTAVKVNVLQNLAKVGAFDALSPNRALMLAKINILKKKIKATDLSFEIKEGHRLSFEVKNVEIDGQIKQEIVIDDFSDLEKEALECEFTDLNFRVTFFENKEKILKKFQGYSDDIVCAILSECLILEKKKGGHFARLKVFNLFKNKFESWLFFGGHNKYTLKDWIAFKAKLAPQTVLFAKGNNSRDIFFAEVITPFNKLIES